MARIDLPDNNPVTIFCAHELYGAFVQQQYAPSGTSKISLHQTPDGGSAIIDSAGSIAGISGRLQPIADGSRTYIYLEGMTLATAATAAAQPFDFHLGQPLQIQDATGKAFELTVKAIRGRTSIIEFRKLGQ